MKKIGLLLVAGLLVLAGCGQGAAESKSTKEDHKIVIGSQGGDIDIWKFIAKSAAAEKAGLDIEVKEVNGGPQLNNATRDGQVDVNAFQSLGYLVSYNKESQAELTPIATTYLEPMGIYSDKFKNIDAVTNGAEVALADNPANTARGLRLLEAAGLIKLKADFDNGTGTPADIIENPKELKFTLIDDTTGPRILQDVDLVLIGNTIAFEGGLNVLKDAIYKEEVDENTKTSINVLVTTKDKADDADLNKLAALYHTDEVKEYIKENFGGTKVDVQQDIKELWSEVQK